MYIQARQVMIIKLPSPDKDLMPNRRLGKHWAATIVKKDNARDKAYLLTLEALRGCRVIFIGMIPLTIIFVQSDKRHRDLDNLLASAKSSLDGVAKGLKVDDRLFEPITVKRRYDTKSYMIVELEGGVTVPRHK